MSVICQVEAPVAQKQVPVPIKFEPIKERNTVDIMMKIDE